MSHLGTQSDRSQIKTPERYSVLVVDDEVDVLVNIDGVLSEHAKVTLSDSATHALKMVRSEKFHVVIADFSMPNLNGAALIEEVRRLPYYVSCLMITGSEEYRARASGQRYYVLVKPFDPSRLVRLVVELGRVAEMKRSVQSLGAMLRTK